MDDGLHYTRDSKRRAQWHICVGLLTLLTLVSCTGCDALSDSNGEMPKLAWHLALSSPGSVFSNPNITQSSAFIPVDSEIQRIDLPSGEVRWQAPLANDLDGKLHADAKAVYAYEFGEWLRAYAIEDGRLLWHTSLGEARSGSFTNLLDAGDYLYVPLADSIVKVHKADGALSTLARLPREASEGLPQRPNFAALDEAGNLCVPVDYPFPGSEYPGVVRKGLVYAIDGTTGAVRWVHRLAPVERNGVTFEQRANACVVAGSIFATVASDHIVGLDKVTGELAWNQDQFLDPNTADAFSLSPAATDGARLFVGSTQEKIYALDINSGEVAWTTMTQGSLSNDLPVVQEDRVYIVNRSFGELWVMDRRTGEVRAHMEPPEELEDNFRSWVAVGEGYLVVLGFRQVYAYKL